MKTFLKKTALVCALATTAIGASASNDGDIITPLMTAGLKNLVINEIMASNPDVFMDHSHNYSSWIELYNPSSVKVQVGGLYISNDPENLKKWRLDEGYGAIGSKAYMIINFGHYGVWNDGELMSVNFNLSHEGGTIYISDNSGVVIQQEYPEAIDRTSYARITDGNATWGITSYPTPNESNKKSTFATEQVAAPVFNLDGCVYDEALDIRITAEEGATIYITIDGSVPTQENYFDKSDSFRWNIENGNYAFRARAYKDGMLPSNVVTRTYIKNQGFTHPIVSVTGSFDDLYGEDYGIMYSGVGWNGRPGNGQSYPRNFNMDWERPVNFEYITPEGEYALSQEVDMSISGGWSRAYYPQSFKLKAGKHHMGLGTLDYPFFAKKPYNKYKVLQLRNGGNEYSSRTKDVALQQIITRSGLYVDTQEWQPVHVFINGDYHATLNMREPNNKQYGYSNYGIDTDEMDQFEMSPDSGYVQKEGTDDAFLEWYDLSAEAADPLVYEQISQLVDIDEYINYMAVQLYLANKDWPQNNVKGFRDQKDGKFHFVIFDLDQTFQTADAGVFTTFAGKKNYTFNELLGYKATGEYLYGMRIKEEIKMVTIFLNMLQNETFRKRFIDTFCIVGGSVFEPTKVKEIANDVKDIMMSARNAMNSDFRDRTYDRDSRFNPATNTQEVISKLTADRNTTMMTAMKNYAPFDLKSITAKSMRLSSNIDEAKLFINDIEVPYSKFVGKLFRPTVLKAKAPAGYRFRGWTKSLVVKPTPDEYEYVAFDETFELSSTFTATTLRAIYEPIPEEELAALNTHPVVVNEVCAKNGIYINDYKKKADWFELYNTTSEDIDLAGLYLSDNPEKPLKYQIPVGDDRLNTIIPAHGYRIVWADKNESLTDQLHADFKIDADCGVVMITAVPDVASPSLFTASHSGEWTDSLSYTLMAKGETIGRYPDGAADTYLMTIPSIGKPNQLGFYSVPVWLAPEETAIIAVETTPHSADTEYYTLSGIRIPRPQPGINIVKTSDGKVKKMRM